MNREHYRFQLGDFECAALADGSTRHPPGHLFANVSKGQIREELARCNLPTDYVVMPCTHLYVNTGEHRILIDLGMGSLTPSTGRLSVNLKAISLDPREVDTVIITHAHPAQMGGTLNGEGKPVYARARYYIWKGEWAFWTSEVAFARAPERHITMARENFEPIRDRLHLIDREEEIVPGVSVILAPGHTPGHVVVLVSSGGEQLLYVGDTVLHPLHLEHPDWISIYDILPGCAAASKRHILDLAADESALVCAHRFPPFPSLGHVVKLGEGWQWQPIGMNGATIVTNQAQKT